MFTPSAMIALTRPMLKIVSGVPRLHEAGADEEQATSANRSSARVSGAFGAAVAAGTVASALISISPS
jgi:hypothetical protein